ncbi:MAG: hypothetical protein DRG40_02195 [Deltaproteobacteria bacterium]|nr:MAG: hypothetical protein DRG40_02195 [Deltaproteobacteria bacterium]
MEGRYKVIFLGPADEAPEAVQRLKEEVVRRFRLSPQEAERLVEKAPIKVKRNASWEEATSLKEALERAGGRASVEPMEAIPASSPDTPRMMQCPQCGYVQPEGEECIRCGVVISKYLRYKEAEKQRGVSPAGEEPAWEQIGEKGVLRGIFQTIKEVLFSPTRFFRQMPVEKGIQMPLLFGVIMGTFGGLMPLWWNFLLSARMMGIRGLFSSTFFILYALLLPIFTAITIFVASGVNHACLMLVKGNKRGFEATFRVIAYSEAAYLWNIIPLLGGLIYSFYTVILYIIGLREVHGITTGRAALAVFIPLIVFLLVFFFLVAAVVIPLIMGISGMGRPPGMGF